MPAQDPVLEPVYRWLPPRDAPEDVATIPDLHPVAARALANRGLLDRDAARAFLDRAPGVDDPFLLADIEKAVCRLRAAVAAGEPIVVYGDFDADGVTATAVLVETLGTLGADVKPFIPHRQRDGYGVHATVLRRLAAEGARVVVTVDCGIRAEEEIADATRLGLDVIVTDHHALADRLPGAIAVINPRRVDCSYPFMELSGVGLAYKLAQAMLRSDGDGASAAEREAALLDLVAIGTVADVVPLVGENRSLVHRGLVQLRSTRRPGLRALAEAAGMELETASARDIAFALGPRLNAAGRMDSADPALSLLLADDVHEAGRLASVLEARNQERRSATDVALAQAEAALEGSAAEPFVFFASDAVELGITGLVAGRLMARYYRPAAVVRVDGDLCRGSVRSIPEFDIVRALDQEAHRLVRYGGHARAAGFTVLRSQLDALRDALRDHAAAELEGVDLRPGLQVDADVGVADLDWPLYDAISALEPYGEANPRPVLAVRGARVQKPREVGRGHLRFSVPGSPGGALEAIAFGRGHLRGLLPDVCDVAATLRANTWGGTTKLELRVEDIAPAAGALGPGARSAD